MPQIFHRSFNTLSRVSIFGAVFIIAAVAAIAGQIVRSPHITGVHEARLQPVPFSHQHHVRDLGIDCRFCHVSVEVSPFAGMPSTKTCMNCHSQVWSDAPVLEPVRSSFRENKSIPWVRIYRLPDYVYFDHSIHLSKGVGCVTCHGQVDEMPLTWRETSLTMEWCLDCHRQPARYVRPREKVFDLHWTPTGDPNEQGPQLVSKYNIGSPRRLSNCSICHR